MQFVILCTCAIRKKNTLEESVGGKGGGGGLHSEIAADSGLIHSFYVFRNGLWRGLGITSLGMLKKTLKFLFQFQQRAWTQEEWEIPTVLQGLGPNDVEAEDGPE